MRNITLAIVLILVGQAISLPIISLVGLLLGLRALFKG